jgi:hypothetical protein
MDCAAILELLSQYIDGTLDVKTRAAVEKHIAACGNCKRELASFRAMVHELGTLDPVTPPADFLGKIHERMARPSGFNKIFGKLFTPFYIKIPLELAAAATVAILVVLVLNIQQPEIQKLPPPIAARSREPAQKPKADRIKPALKKQAEHPTTVMEKMTEELSDSEPAMLTRKSGIKTPAPSMRQESKPPLSFMEKSESKPTAGKNHPVELALVLRTGVIGGAVKPGIAMQAAPLSENQKSTIEKERAHIDFFEKKIGAGKKDRTADLFSRIKLMIDRAQGKILTVEYHGQAEQLKSIDAKIPAKTYDSFCRELTGLATFQTPPPDLSDKDLETIRVYIRFISL